LFAHLVLWGVRTLTLSQRARRWCGLRGNLFGVVPILVYQMAKVGSSTIVAALEKAGLPVVHVHRMDAAHLERMRAARRALGWSEAPLPAHDLLGLRIRRTLFERGGRAKIVTLVRDPIARNFSSYFEHLDAIFGTVKAYAHVPMQTIVDGFLQRFPHDDALTWFDDELLPVTGVDVYAQPFPAGGHTTIHAANVDVLILKSELPDAEKSAALSAFLGIPPPALQAINRTADKAKGAPFQEFVRSARPDDAYLDRMLESRYARHFYSAAERAAFRRRFTAGSALSGR
jgi:hypothetical protein